MNIYSFLGFLLIVGIGSYLQAFTGFALGIFVLGAAVAFQLASVETTATAINIMMMVNSALALHSNLHLVDRKLFLRTLVGIFPGVPVGVWILEMLSASNALLLQVILGVIVVLAGALLYVRPKSRVTASPPSSFVVAGVLGGILGGMFSIPGPPVIYHLYNQPIPFTQTRLTLLAIFGMAAFVRLGILVASGGVSSDAVSLGLLSLPMVAITTAVFIRFPPRMSETTMRRTAFAMLSVMGFGILATTWK